MYKCPDCGCVFEEGEEQRWTESHGERMSGCPVCGCVGYSDAKMCEECGEWMIGEPLHLENELFCGRCIDCLKEAICTEYLLEFLDEQEEMVEFVFEFLFGAKVKIEQESELLHAHARETILRKALDDKIIGKLGKTVTLDELFLAYLERRHMLDREWAEFVDKKEEGVNK